MEELLTLAAIDGRTSVSVLTVTNGRQQWLPDAVDGLVRRSDVTEKIRTDFRHSIDTLAAESSLAQGLKEPVTSYEKLTSPNSYSPHRHEDTVYALVKIRVGGAGSGDGQNAAVESVEAIGYMRVGRRSLYFEWQESLRKYDCVCVMDFYVRHRRQGHGFLLMNGVMKHLNTKACEVAYDKPTDTMICFLKRHYGLDRPRRQHNRFVIFDEFHAKPKT